MRNLFVATRDTHVRSEDFEPTRRTIILARVLEAERHSVLVHFPSGDGVPLELHHLRLQRSVLLRGVQFESRHAHRGYNVALLSRIARAMWEHDVAVSAEFPRQFQILQNFAMNSTRALQRYTSNFIVNEPRAS